MKVSRYGLASALLAGALVLGACTQTSSIASTAGTTGAAGDSGAPAQPVFVQFSDIPIPEGATMDVERTLVFGSGDRWYGRLVMNADQGPFDLFDLFKQHFPNFGWQEISSLRSETSVLTYLQGDRVATVQITGERLSGSEVIFTIAPRSSEAAPPAAPPAGPSPIR